MASSSTHTDARRYGRGGYMIACIRVSFKDTWHPDLLRVECGIIDCGLIGEIDVQVLCQFQNSHRSPAQPLKPVPDEFEIDFGRKVLLAGEKE